MERYVKDRLVGKGSFGSVYLVRELTPSHTPLFWVMKMIKLRGMRTRERHSAFQEVKLLRHLHHPHICRYHDSFIHKPSGQLCLVMTYCEGGDLHGRVQRIKREGSAIAESCVLRWVSQLALALQYIHERHNLIHRDVKTQNAFLRADDSVMLGDFGVSRVLDSPTDLAHTCVGTPFYMCPELVRKHRYSNKADMWALGIVVYELTTLRHAFDANDMQGLGMKIVRGRYPPLPSHYSADLHALVEELLRGKASERPSATEMLQRPLMRAALAANAPIESAASRQPPIIIPRQAMEGPAVLKQACAGRGDEVDAAAPSCCPAAHRTKQAGNVSTPHQEIQHVEGGGGRGFGKAKAKDAIEMSREKMRARLAELEEERRRLDMQRRKLQAGRREKKQQPTKRNGPPRGPYDQADKVECPSSARRDASRLPKAKAAQRRLGYGAHHPNRVFQRDVRASVAACAADRSREKQEMADEMKAKIKHFLWEARQPPSVQLTPDEEKKMWNELLRDQATRDGHAQPSAERMERNYVHPSQESIHVHSLAPVFKGPATRGVVGASGDLSSDRGAQLSDEEAEAIVAEEVASLDAAELRASRLARKSADELLEHTVAALLDCSPPCSPEMRHLRPTPMLMEDFEAALESASCSAPQTLGGEILRKPLVAEGGVIHVEKTKGDEGEVELEVEEVGWHGYEASRVDKEQDEMCESGSEDAGDAEVEVGGMEQESESPPPPGSERRQVLEGLETSLGACELSIQLLRATLAPEMSRDQSLALRERQHTEISQQMMSLLPEPRFSEASSSSWQKSLQPWPVQGDCALAPQQQQLLLPSLDSWHRQQEGQQLSAEAESLLDPRVHYHDGLSANCETEERGLYLHETNRPDMRAALIEELGEPMFLSACEYLKVSGSDKAEFNEQMRQDLVSILGEERLKYWPLIDMCIFGEELDS